MFIVNIVSLLGKLTCFVSNKSGHSLNCSQSDYQNESPYTIVVKIILENKVFRKVTFNMVPVSVLKVVTSD